MFIFRIAASVETTCLAASKRRVCACTQPAWHRTNINFPADSSSSMSRTELLRNHQHALPMVNRQAWSGHSCIQAGCQGPRYPSSILRAEEVAQSITPSVLQVQSIVETLLEALPTPSYSVQEAVSDCLAPLMSGLATHTTYVQSLAQRLLAATLSGPDYPHRYAVPFC